MRGKHASDNREMISVFINIVIGICVGMCIGMLYITKMCVIYHGPNSNEIKKWIWHNTEDGLYYKFDTIPYVCPPLMTNCVKSE